MVHDYWIQGDGQLVSLQVDGFTGSQQLGGNAWMAGNAWASIALVSGVRASGVRIGCQSILEYLIADLLRDDGEQGRRELWVYGARRRRRDLKS